MKKYRIFYYFAVILLAYYLLSLNYGSKTFSDSDNVVDRATGKLSESMFAVFSISSGNISPYVFEGLNASSYAQLTNYWIAFKGASFGFHDASWRSRFGGNIYTYNGSHGCVNMPRSEVSKLYNMVEIGTPVYVH